MTRRRGTWVWLLVAAVVLLRHDFWNWHSPRPLLLGFLPVGLWWQAMVSICASACMALLVRYAWPSHLEEQLQQPDVASSTSDIRH